MDGHTVFLFLQEKLTQADWYKHLQHSDSLLVNFATQTLAVTAKIEQHLKPTEAEIEILNVLWENGASTVKFINDKLNMKKTVG